MNARIVEIVAAVLCLLLTLIGLGIASFAAAETHTSEAVVVSYTDDATHDDIPEPVVTEETTSFLDDVEPVALIYLIVMLLLGVTVLTLTLLHGRWPATASDVPFWITAMIMLGLVLIAGFSIGLFFLPATLAAIITAIAGTLHARRLRIT
jgi:hypothetical protein